MQNPIRATLITVEQARAMLQDQRDQRSEPFPTLALSGQYILPDYRLTRKREAFKIRRHTFLKKHFRSYVAFDSDNGQTLWIHNFPSLSEACFWLNTGVKPNDTDSTSSYQEWKVKHVDEIEVLKEQLRTQHHEKKKAVVPEKKPTVATVKKVKHPKK
ncbi:hypothetical protein [Levilactobacillus spicheri]|uniref:Uncharacterized protein n=2 Tax=Levilactobacillus spicheri TaxID=216463 RepID=A0ABQ0WR85_9LACO|nr:hypothetical protein [Levilactobacillus spicheri]KRL46930.1 hypothetical protein FD37_GL000410 [Levilactobacillus spicheri DSM 15429]GEO66564.1 hypothetical protein LSP04_09830 [Levilactobacillus spicheri]